MPTNTSAAFKKTSEINKKIKLTNSGALSRIFCKTNKKSISNNIQWKKPKNKKKQKCEGVEPIETVLLVKT